MASHEIRAANLKHGRINTQEKITASIKSNNQRKLKLKNILLYYTNICIAELPTLLLYSLRAVKAFFAKCHKSHINETEENI